MLFSIFLLLWWQKSFYKESYVQCFFPTSFTVNFIFRSNFHSHFLMVCLRSFHFELIPVSHLRSFYGLFNVHSYSLVSKFDIFRLTFFTLQHLTCWKRIKYLNLRNSSSHRILSRTFLTEHLKPCLVLVCKWKHF